MELMSEYIENGYPEKLFYYCLRKTGDVREAEDLASDISLCVIQELSRGVVPQSFSAWVWKIAGSIGNVAQSYKWELFRVGLEDCRQPIRALG